MKTRNRMFSRAAMMLLLMVLTTSTASAFKTETPKIYVISRNSHTFSISPGSSWSTTNAIWAANEGHALDNGITITPDENVSYQNSVLQTTIATTFTFTVPSNLNVAITSVVFKDASGNEVSGASHSEPGTTYTVTLASGTSVKSFVLTYGYISGSCGTNATWTLSKQNGQYTALTISGSGTMKDDYGYETVEELWRTKAPWDWHDLKSVTIENGITSIGQYNFIGCQQLSSLTIGTGVTTIGNNAFDHCDKLTQVTLPASVSNINNCFKNCYGLQRLNIQRTDGLVTLGSNGLNGCNKLKYIVAPTLALAVQYKTATNWNASEGKMSADFGGYVFYATTEGGTGAYAITNEADLRHLASAINSGSTGSEKTFRQTDDIILSDTNFEPIGKESSLSFDGSYDGGGYVIYGLHISHLDGIKYYGLFGFITEGTVKNVRLRSPSVNVGNVDNSTYYGALIGEVRSSTVENCVVLDPYFVGSGGTKGAIIGRTYSSTLQNLYFYEGDCSDAIGNSSSGTITNVGRARKVTLGSGISSVTPAISPTATNLDNGFVYNDNLYYREGLALTLTTNLSATTGYHINYRADDRIISNPYTVNSTDGDVTLSAEQMINVPYIDADGQTQYCDAYIFLTNETDIYHLSAGWYVVKEDVSNNEFLYCESGDIHLILSDGAKMTLNTNGPSIFLVNGNLTIYAQSTGSSMGQLEATSKYNSCLEAADNITICGGRITATSKNGSGIQANNNVTIHNGQVNATGTSKGYSQGYGIYGNHVTIHSGQVNATGYYGIQANNVTLGLRNATDYITANKYRDYVTYIADGQMLTDGTNIYSGGLTSAQINAIAGKTLRRVFNLVTLADNANNSSTISNNNNKTATVVLNGRTLYKDGAWNTLCLPFEVSTTTGPLSGDNVKAMVLRKSGSGLQGTTLNLYFDNASGTIPAGTPFIIRWGTPQSNPNTTLTNPLFTDVTIDNSAAAIARKTQTSQDGKVSFKGIYAKQEYTEEDKSILLLGTNSTLYWPQSGASIGACRAYFELSDPVVAVRQFVLNFGDNGEAQGIKEIEDGRLKIENEAGAWFDLNGRKLDGVGAGPVPARLRKGLYIHGGRKVVIK